MMQTLTIILIFNNIYNAWYISILKFIYMVNIEKYANRYKYLRRVKKGHKRSNIKNYSYRVEVPPPQDTEQVDQLCRSRQ